MTTEIQLRKQEMKHERQMNELNVIKDVVLTLVTNPVIGYIGGMLLIEYLDTSDGYRPQYIPQTLGLGMQGALTGAMVANALGGGQGIGGLLGGLSKLLK
jgi:hypothetical protein